MKCKTCGHRSNTINAMRKHYISKHPDKMKRHTSTKEPRLSTKTKNGKYCPNCGKKL